MSTPTFRIEADRVDVTAVMQQRFMSLRISDEAGMTSDLLELSLDDPDGAIALPRTGAVLKVHLGYQASGLADMGAYTVDEVELEGPPGTIHIRARAADFRQELKAPKTRPWHQTTLGQMVEKIASEHGYTPQISPALAEVELGHVDQTNESDLNLLTRMARQHGATAKAAGGALVFVDKAALVTPTGKAMPSVTLRAREITSWRATLPERGKYPAVVAEYHDKTAGKRVKVTSGSGEPAYTLRRTYPTEAQAERAARGKLAEFERGLATLSLTLPGRPELVAESAVVVEGIRAGVDGTWAIKRVEHSLSSSGYTCQVEAEIPKS